MNEPILWVSAGFLGATLGMGCLRLARRWLYQRRHGPPIPHQDLLVRFGGQMAGLLDQQAVGRLLAADVPESLEVTEAMVLLAVGRELVATADNDLRLPVHNAAVRWVASAGEAMRADGRLRDLITQGRTDLSWTAVWAPLMRGAELYGIWLLGERAGKLSYASEDLRWLTALARQAAIVLETIRHARQERQLASEMQVLYRQAVAARESERSRLARELHDGVLQDLCAVARDLKALEAQLGDRAPLHSPVRHSSEAVRTLREICQDLRPPLLQSNLVVALKALVERLDTNSASPISIKVGPGTANLSEETALALYRIAQEALHNAIQHADASEIAVRLTQYPDRLRLTVTDDGRGIAGGADSHRFVAEGHLGLAGMRERAAMIGGRLDIQSAVDYGTAVIVEVP